MGLMKWGLEKFVKIATKVDEKREASKAPLDGVESRLDIPYLDDGHPMHTLDVFRPEGSEETLPIIIDIHGGAWFYGNKEINAYYCQHLAKYGFTVVNINYRLIREGQGGTFPNNLSDVFSAFKWVCDHADEIKGDLSRVFLTGDSAGAHIACLAAIINYDPELSAELNLKTEIDFRALALTCGVSDLEAYEKRKIPVFKYLFKLFLGDDWKNSPYKKILTFRNTSLNLPPVFLHTSPHDFIREDVKGFYKVLQERGVESELLYYDNEEFHQLDHVYSVLYPEWKESKETIDTLIAFFKKHGA